jgi:hypothetical protein
MYEAYDIINYFRIPFNFYLPFYPENISVSTIQILKLKCLSPKHLITEFADEFE